MASISSTKYAFSLAGAPRNKTARMKALAGTGPLHVAKDQHMIAKMVPTACEEIDDSTMSIALNVMNAMIFSEALILHRDICDGGMHFAVTIARLSQLVKDLDDDGFDFDPINGGMHVAIPKAMTRLRDGIMKLTVEQRTIAAEDVEYDGEYDNAATGEWYDWVTPGLLMSDGAGMTAVNAFLRLTPYSFYGGNEEGRGSSEFADNIANIEAKGRDIDPAQPTGHTGAALAGESK